MFDLVGQLCLPDSSCCINCIKCLGSEKLNDFNENVYDYYKKKLSDKEFHLNTVNALHSSLGFLTDTRKYTFLKAGFIFVSTLIRFDKTIRLHLRMLYSNFFKN